MTVPEESERSPPLKGLSAQQLLQLQHDIVESTEAAHTEYVILSGSNRAIEDSSQEYLLDYVQSTFEVESAFGRYQVLKRRDSLR